MSKLEVARSWLHLKRMKRKCGGRLADVKEAKGDLRDVIAVRFNISGRTLDRWLQVLRLPLPLQQAFEDDQLTLTLAVKAGALDARAQQRIAERIRAGEAPEQVLMEFVAPSKGRHQQALNALAAFGRMLRRGVDDLQDRVESLPAAGVSKIWPDLERAQDVIRQLLKKCSGKNQTRPSHHEEEE
jgi:hypothetical protein